MDHFKLGLSVVFCLATVVYAATDKKGIVHTIHTYQCGDFDVLNNATWWMDYWYTLEEWRIRDTCNTPIDSYPENNTYVPMYFTDRWGISDLDSTPEFVMGFNEANHKLQGNVPADQAATSWIEVKAKALAVGVNISNLVSPAAAPCGELCITNTVEEWFDEFFSLTDQDGGCCDFLATHTYVCDPVQVMSELRKLNERYNKPIWLTEFVCSSVSNDFIMKLFMQTLLPLLDAADFVYRYAWFEARRVGDDFVSRHASLLEQDSPTLSAIGEIYNDYQGGSIPVDDINAYEYNETDTAFKTLTGVFRYEALLVLNAYVESFAPWSDIFTAITWNIPNLPLSAQAFYVSTDKPGRKTRIKDFFKILICESPAVINDVEVNNEIARIKALPVDPDKKNKLKIPSCP